MAGSEILSGIAEVAAPAGAGLAVLGLIFGQIIKSGRFGGLTPEHRYSIARQIIWASTLVALASILAFAIGTTKAGHEPDTQSPPPAGKDAAPTSGATNASAPSRQESAPSPSVPRQPRSTPVTQPAPRPDENPYANLTLEQLKSQADTAYDEGQFTRAFSLNSEACRRHSGGNCYWNGYLKENGMGFAVNIDHALTWYSRACALGHSESCERKNQLQSQ